jgi:hypothetical protein
MRLANAGALSLGGRGTRLAKRSFGKTSGRRRGGCPALPEAVILVLHHLIDFQTFILKVVLLTSAGFFSRKTGSGFLLSTPFVFHSPS